MAVKRNVVTTAKHDAILIVKILVLLVAVILVIKLVRVIAHIFVLPPQGILHLAQAIPVRLGVKVVALAPVEIYVMTLVMTLAMIPVAVLVSVIAKAHAADLAYLHVMMVVTQSVVG